MLNQDGLREIVDVVGRDVARVAQTQDTPGQEKASAARLVASWGRLVDFLALGPAPELRDCPYCGRVGMRAATRCGYCWKKLVPPAPLTAH